MIKYISNGNQHIKKPPTVINMVSALFLFLYFTDCKPADKGIVLKFWWYISRNILIYIIIIRKLNTSKTKRFMYLKEREILGMLQFSGVIGSWLIKMRLIMLSIIPVSQLVTRQQAILVLVK